MFIKDRVAFSKRQITDEGYMVISDCRIARTGIQEYLAIELGAGFEDREPTDVVRVYRSPDEVFSSDAMASFELTPVTNDHPPEGVNSANFKDKAVGVASNIRRDGIFLIADLKITDASAVKDVDSGKKQLSNGYLSDLEIKAGTTPEGENFDAQQRRIMGNHVAIVDAARCGPRCSISDTKPKPKGKIMNLTIDGVPFDVSDETLAGAIKNVIAKATNAASALSTAQTNHDNAMASLKAEHDIAVQDMQAQLDQAMANQMTPEKLDAVIEERAQIISDAKALLPEIETKGQTCMAIKRQVVTSKFGDSIAAELMENDVYVNARFDALVQTPAAPSKTGTADLMSDSAAQGPENQVSPAEVARRRKLIGDKIAYKFAPGSRQTAEFKTAVDEEYNRVHGA